MSATSESASVARLLRDAYPRHAAKQTARAANVPLATAKSWVAGRFTPSAATLLRMADACDLIAAAIERRIHGQRAAAGDSRSVAARGDVAAQAGGEVT